MARIGKWTKIYLDDSGGTARDLSTDLTDIDGLPLTADEIEVGGYTQDKQYLAGRQDSQITLTGNFTTTASTGTHTVISGVNNNNTVCTLTVQKGDNATPTSGDPEFEGEFIVMNYTPKPDLNGSMTFTVNLRPAYGQSIPTWGTVA